MVRFDGPDASTSIRHPWEQGEHANPGRAACCLNATVTEVRAAEQSLRLLRCHASLASALLCDTLQQRSQGNPALVQAGERLNDVRCR